VSESKAVVEELQAVKKLLIALLVKLGSTSEEIGDVLDIDASRVRQLVPITKIKKIKED
jgi:DNA-directed RNA polymerase specialized sigma subunit